MKYRVNLLDKNNKAIFEEVYRESDTRIQRILTKALKEKYFKLELYRPHIASASSSIVHTALLDYQKYSNRTIDGNDCALIPLDKYTLKYIHDMYGSDAYYEQHGVYYTAYKNNQL